MNVAVQAVSYVQYTLDDYIDGIPKPIDDVICERFTQDKRIKSEPQLALFHNDHLGELYPVCPRCGSRKHIRYGFYKRRPKIGDSGKITLHVQKYRCKKCGKRFSARIDGIVTKWRQYAEIFKERVNAIAAIMKHSGRKIREVLLALFGVAPSHQTIENWLFAEMPTFLYSGFYTYDEQVVKIKGKEAFRLTLFDAVLNIPVAEEISYKLNAKRVKRFLKKNVKGLPLYSVTTDDRKWYREIITGLNAIHQLCGFHFIKRVTKDAEYYFKLKSLSDAEKIRIAVLVNAIREVFRSVTEKEFF